MLNRNLFFFLVKIIILAIIAAGCAPVTSEQSADSDLMAASQPPTIEFTLVTGESEGKMVFFGSGGAIDGMVNPDLRVSSGDIVKVTLVNGDAVLHDFAIPDLEVQSEAIAKMDKKTEVIFKVKVVGTKSYYCTIPGHRQAGMEGLLIAEGSNEEEEEASNASVVRSPDDLPGPLSYTESSIVKVELETTEVEARLSDGTSYKFWTFNGKVPGPFIRVRVGDTVEVVLKNNSISEFMHSVDFHATTGPGGGAVATQTKPGTETSFTFKAINPGLFVYHCATPMVAHHISNGMYGIILVEPEEGLPEVDHEFYVMQGEVYTAEPLGEKGILNFDLVKLLDEHPEYIIFNGSVGALTEDAPLKADVGDTVRIFFGVGGPNLISSFHVIGEIFDRVYNQASLTSDPLTNVQTTIVAPGGAAMVEFTIQVPGRYLLVDHALSRLERGLVGYLLVSGPENEEIFKIN